jgi:Flp pilus assembly protein TadD
MRRQSSAPVMGLHIPAGILFWVAYCSLAGAACTAPSALEARLHPTPTAEAYASQGNWFAGQRQFSCAAASFASAVKLQPQSASLFYLWGLSLYSAGNDYAAETPLRKAVLLDPSDVRPHLVLGAALERLKKTADAEAEWRAALALDPQSVTALDSLSRELIEQNNYASVIALLGKPGRVLSPLQALNLGTALAGSGQLDDAARELREGLKTAPGTLALAHELADVLVLLDRSDEAIAVLDPVIQGNHVDLNTRILYFRTLLSAQSEQAREVGQKLLLAAPRNWEVLYLNGVLESGEAEWQPAREHLEQSIALKPDYARAHSALGVVLAKLKNAQGAKAQLQQAIALGDAAPEIQFALGRVLESLGESEEAKAHIKAYQQLKAAQADRTQGDHALAAGDPAHAAALYREALENTPNDALLAYKLGKTLEKIHDDAGERAALQRSIELNPQLAEAQSQLGYLLLHNGETAQAEEHFRAAVHASPFYTVAWINLAAALASEARWQQAKEALGNALEIDPDNAKARQLKLAIAQAEMQP